LTEVHDVNFDWIFNPCDEIGGDLFNIFKLDNEHLGIFFIDVSGHGVSSALFSFALSKILSPLPDQSSLFREYAENPDSASILPPGEVAKHLNNRFPLDTETEQYFTLLYGILDRKSQEFHYVSAGHPGIVYHAYNSSPRIISVASPPIGFIPGFEYQEKIIPLSSGDRLYIYSDGIVEAGNKENQLFGKKGLTEALAESRNSPLKDTLQFLINSLYQWLDHEKAEDDISILGIEIV
ncbi:MAG TPA: serine/threonine-protein phosphatase, partial [Spirochaetales bacterium]|nr:serine/threonine-protein phosphatase [Spirochaetales bacterium]